jgi:hypothetical protein
VREETRVGVESDLGAPWTSLPWPVLVVDRAGDIQSMSDSVRSVLPVATAGMPLEEATPPWLSQAHRNFHAKSPTVTGFIDGRGFDAHPAVLAGGDVAWCLVEDTARSGVDQSKPSSSRSVMYLTMTGAETCGISFSGPILYSCTAARK